MESDLNLAGVTPANITPFEPGGESIHEDDLRNHIADLVAVDGVTGILCNGHAGEVYALDRDERIRVVEIIDDVTDANTPIVAGVVGGSTTQVIEDIKRSQEAGADAILVVPPHTPISDHGEAAVTFFRDIAKEADAPLIVFQHPVWAGGFYDSELLGKIVEVDGVEGVKSAIWDVDHYQEDVRALRDSDADVEMYVANDEHMLPCLAIQNDGIFLELAAVIPEYIVDLYDAIQESDLPRARRVYETMEMFVDAMYEPPITDSHTRLKVALALQGKIETAEPRKPAMPISDEETASIKQAMRESNLDV